MAEKINTIDDLKDLLGGHPIAMVTTANEQGTLSSRPLTVQEMDMSGNIRFLVDRRAGWVHDFVGAASNAAFVDKGGSWVSISGALRMLQEDSLVDRYSGALTDSYFDEKSEPVVLQLDGDRVEWWTADGRVSQLVELVKSKITRSQPKLGESGTVKT